MTQENESNDVSRNLFQFDRQANALEGESTGAETRPVETRLVEQVVQQQATQQQVAQQTEQVAGQQAAQQQGADQQVSQQQGVAQQQAAQRQATQQRQVAQQAEQQEAEQAAQQQGASQQAQQQQGASQQPQQQMARQQAAGQEEARQQAAQQQAAQQQAARQQAAYQQQAYQQARQQPYQQQPAYQQPYQQQPAYQQPYQQPAYQQAPQIYYAVPQPQTKKWGWVVPVIILVVLLILLAFSVRSCSNSVYGSGMGGLGSLSPSGDSVAVISIDGTIQYDGSACSPEGFKELLDRAADSENIKAVVLRVNSGGGAATAGEEMATYLREFSKPVVVSSASLNASAAYEISSQADYIYVAKSTEIGAIGTAMELTDMSGLLDMLGINMDVITSADSKDSSYGYRPLTEEERAYYQHMIDQINDMFVETVATGRKMSVDDVRALATGLSFTGADAVANGLADEVGTLENAADKAAELAGVTDYELYDLVLYDYSLSSLYSLFGSEESHRALPLLKQEAHN